MKNLIFSKQSKITITVLLSIANIYIIYAMAMCYFTWLRQPRFILPDGSHTSSLGFIITLLIYAGIFLISLSVLAISSIGFYTKKFKRKKKLQKNPPL